jgi:hypothetical protein
MRVWLTQKLIGSLFDVDRSIVTGHKGNIYQEGGLVEEATRAIFAQVRTGGNRQLTRDVGFCNLYVVISIGYSVHFT